MIFCDHGIAGGMTNWLIKKRNLLLNPKYYYFLLLLDCYLTQILFGGEREMFIIGELSREVKHIGAAARDAHKEGQKKKEKIPKGILSTKIRSREIPKQLLHIRFYTVLQILSTLCQREMHKTTKNSIPVNKNRKNGI